MYSINQHWFTLEVGKVDIVDNHKLVAGGMGNFVEEGVLGNLEQYYL